MVDGIPRLISLVLTKSTDIQQTHCSNMFIKKSSNNNDKNNLKAVFCLLKLFVYIQVVTWIGLSSNATVLQWTIRAGWH